jgi:hypothetical protein
MSKTLADLLNLMRQNIVPHWTAECLEKAIAETEQLKAEILHLHAKVGRLHEMIHPVGEEAGNQRPGFNYVDPYSRTSP